MGLYHRVQSPKDEDRMANSVDPDQTAVCSGSTMFAQTCLSKNLGSLQYGKSDKFYYQRNRSGGYLMVIKQWNRYGGYLMIIEAQFSSVLHKNICCGYSLESPHRQF